MFKFISQKSIHYLVLLQAAVAMGGSLFFSEVMKFAPCVLCSYQRICMYPIVLLSIVGILRKDRKLALYVLPLSVIGMFIALYHNLLYVNVIPNSGAFCKLGISCTTVYVQYFHFLTIPLMSLLAFVIITGLMVISLRKSNQEVNAPLTDNQ